MRPFSKKHSTNRKEEYRMLVRIPVTWKWALLGSNPIRRLGGFGALRIAGCVAMNPPQGEPIAPLLTPSTGRPSPGGSRQA